jgi:hypothetical protein
MFELESVVNRVGVERCVLVPAIEFPLVDPDRGMLWACVNIEVKDSPAARTNSFFMYVSR